MPGFCGEPVYTWKSPCDRLPGYFVDSLNFASDFAPDQLSDSGKLASFQNGAPYTLCFPWKFPETQSAGDPLFSFLFAGKLFAGKPATAQSPSSPSSSHSSSLPFVAAAALLQQNLAAPGVVSAAARSSTARAFQLSLSRASSAAWRKKKTRSGVTWSTWSTWSAVSN